MATATRPAKGQPIKKAQESSSTPPPPQRRAPAWGLSRSSIAPIPPFSPNANNTRSPNGFPALAQANGKVTGGGGPSEEREKLLASLAGSIGSTITVTLRSNTRYEGTLTFVTPSPGEDASLTLKDAKDITVPGAPLKDSLSISAANVLSFTPGQATAPAGQNKADSFRTDTDISRTTSAQQKRERELQAWQPDVATDASNGLPPALSTAAAQSAFQRGDDVTFGPNAAAGGAWDQFAANERLFGVTTKFDEDVYTTKLDRSAKDYREKEKRAEKIAAEISGAITSNPHVAEERGMVVDDSGMNEEDKYGAVVRGAGAYVPPGARRSNSNTSNNPISPPPTSATHTPTPSGAPPKEKEPEKDKGEVPRLSVNGPDGTEKVIPASGGAVIPPANGGSAVKAPADALPAFRDFVTNERQRLTQKRQALVKSEMDKRMAELVKFSQSFKLNKPIPEDLVPILAKDEQKQRQIREKSTQDAESVQARAIGAGSSSSNNAQVPMTAKVAPTGSKQQGESRKSTVPTAGSKAGSGMTTSKTSNALSSATKSGAAAGQPTANGVGNMTASSTVPRVSMVIQTIPPFRGSKQKQPSGDNAKPAAAAPPPAPAPSAEPPMSPTTAQRLNVNAQSFRPNPKAVAFTPTGPATSGTTASASASPKGKSQSVPQPPNPFFGNQVIKKNPPVNVKDDFNPFKYNKVAEASVTTAMWPFNGKRYIQMFPPPPPPPPQASPHMTPHGPPPPPPPSYDEDAAQQAAARGYAVYAYSPYQYPGQPPHPQMMAGMAAMPQGFVPSPYMQPIQYPPHMAPPNGQPMYAPPPMGQMPPPQSYMPPPPPPGAYPPPPNGAGPRPSMPPTPIPAHAHPYYHQSPQLQHAVPYPMMMPPPGPNGPPHPYETGPPPPVPMGGVGHA